MSPEPARDVVRTSVEVARPSDMIGAAVDLDCLRHLVRSAVWRGGCLDDPWRHAYLRDRWIGQVR
jgi:hypothetical protein